MSFSLPAWLYSFALFFLVKIFTFFSSILPLWHLFLVFIFVGFLLFKYSYSKFKLFSFFFPIYSFFLLFYSFLSADFDSYQLARSQFFFLFFLVVILFIYYSEFNHNSLSFLFSIFYLFLLINTFFYFVSFLFEFDLSIVSISSPDSRFFGFPRVYLFGLVFSTALFIFLLFKNSFLYLFLLSVPIILTFSFTGFMLLLFLPIYFFMTRFFSRYSLNYLPIFLISIFPLLLLFDSSLFNLFGLNRAYQINSSLTSLPLLSFIFGSGFAIPYTDVSYYQLTIPTHLYDSTYPLYINSLFDIENLTAFLIFHTGYLGYLLFFSTLFYLDRSHMYLITIAIFLLGFSTSFVGPAAILYAISFGILLKLTSYSPS